MRAVTVTPGVAGSVRLEDIDEPAPDDGSVLVGAVAVGVCGTDREIIAGEHGEPPPGRERLVLGHESVGRVLAAPADSRLGPGDLVVGIVRRPDPEPCANCAVGEWDMCRNGRYTEHGIKGLDGFARERFRLAPEAAVPVRASLGELAVLLEPASVVAKAWEHVERIGRRASWHPRRVLITGAGPIGLLAALLGRLRGFDVTVLDRVETGPKPELVAALGADYRSGDATRAASDADIVIEATGAVGLVFDVLAATPPNAIVCLTGVSSPGRRLDLAAGDLARELVLENDVVFGSVNANRRHYAAAAAALDEADRGWLERLLTRRVPIDRWQEAYEPRDGDVKTVLLFEGA